eukprot:CAMPEP_0114272288 /NCGR_PEP_ID=MMETSP0058-20121206/28370_1 /TAXON_ID=36894 /ORGANISM="Pyramimonas parkeae, CCMP726" /LENGTH=478 /DNA_ID=CAMNT_0001391439 /DNA_START=247 /DNA_END=1683 /DNA_ORIENTATION=+
MALLNIGASNADDAFYRYKMPPLQSKIEGRGNGIKTNIVNMVDVAKALARPASYTTKFFGCELGAQSKFEDKSGTAIVNGAHDTSKLMQLLEGFIKRFVQCYACGNPETEIQITKSDCINLQCKACGNISNVDMRHKLTTFILKNPPEKKKGSSKADKALRRAEKERLEAGEAADKAEKAARKEARRLEKERLAKEEGVEKKDKKDKKEKKEKKSKVENDKDEESPEDSVEEDAVQDEDDTEWSTDISAAAQAARAAEQLTDASRAMVTVKVSEDELSKAVEGVEKVSLSTPAESNSLSSPKSNEYQDESMPEAESEDEEEIEELIEGLAAFAESRTPDKVAAFLKKLPVDTDSKRLLLLLRALFTEEDVKLSTRVAKHQALMKAVVEEGPILQYALLQAFEALLALHLPDSQKEMPIILKFLYDEDIVVEEVILKWDSAIRCSKALYVTNEDAKKLRKLAFPLIHWLQNATEESDDE